MVVAPIIQASLLIVATLFCFIANSEGEEFSVNLIHRDSPISPLYDPHETPYQRLKKALNRSINRINHLTSANSTRLSVNSKLITDINGGYLMNISIGTPPFQIMALADTGSDVIWTKCSAYPNKGILFTPTLSNTYRTLPCPSKACDYLDNLEGVGFCSPNNDHVCHYKITYGDKSHTLGDFAFDTLNLESTSAPGRTVSFQNTLIGCSYDTKLTFASKGFGIIGLGRGRASLITQLGPSIDWRFSYCLPHSDGPPSTINFGRDVTGPGTVSTPLIYDPSHPSLFFLRLEAMSVGNVRIPFRGSTSEDQNIVIDSGTEYTVLPNEFLSQLSYEVARQVVGMKRVASPFKTFFNLCYEVGPTTAGPINAPPITMNFLNADVKLPLSNIFASVSDTVMCFAFLPTDVIPVYGCLTQENFLVGHDLRKNILSFKPANCGHE